MTKCQWQRASSLLPMTIANSLLPITNCKLPMTKWPKNISISSQFSYELDSIELHSCLYIVIEMILSYIPGWFSRKVWETPVQSWLLHWCSWSGVLDRHLSWWQLHQEIQTSQRSSDRSDQWLQSRQLRPHHSEEQGETAGCQQCHWQSQWLRVWFWRGEIYEESDGSGSWSWLRVEQDRYW